jgi:hypothetical protein
MVRPTRWIRLLTAIVASLGVAMLAVISSASHEQDDPPAAPNGVVAGPARGTNIAMPRGVIGLTITLGLTDDTRTPWDGEVTVSEGRVLSLDAIQGAANPSSDGNRFVVASKKKAAANKKAANKKAVIKKKKAAQKAVQKATAATIPAVIYVNLDAPETSTVTVRSRPGTFSFRPADLNRDGRNTFLDNKVSVERALATVRLTAGGTEDDFPAITRGADGTVWLAYVEYNPDVPRLTTAPSKSAFDTLVPTKNGDRIRLRSFDGTISTATGKFTPGSTPRPTAGRPPAHGARPNESRTRKGRTFMLSPQPTPRDTYGWPGRRSAATTTRSSRSRHPSSRICHFQSLLSFPPARSTTGAR